MLCNIPVFLVYLALDLFGAVPTQHRVLRFYNRNKTNWNDAYEFCKHPLWEGYTMLKMDSEDVWSSFMRLRNSINFRGPYWLGLHDKDERPNKETYTWSDCTELGSYRPWRSQSETENRRCVRGSLDDNIDSWTPEYCSLSAAFVICQKTTGPCTFIGYGQKRVDSSVQRIKVNASIGTMYQCFQECREYDSRPECWGVKWDIDECVLYLSDSYTEFTSKLRSKRDTKTYVKFCFEGLSDWVTEIPTVNKEDDAPHTDCEPVVVPKTATVTTEGTTLTLTTTTASTTAITKTPTAWPKKTKTPKPTNRARNRVYHNVWELGDVSHPRLNAAPDSSFQVDDSSQCVRSCNESCEAINYGSLERVCSIYHDFESAKIQGAVFRKGWFLWVCQI